MYSSVFLNNEGGLEMDLKLNYTELIKKLIVVIIAGLLNAIGMIYFNASESVRKWICWIVSIVITNIR